MRRLVTQKQQANMTGLIQAHLIEAGCMKEEAEIEIESEI